MLTQKGEELSSIEFLLSDSSMSLKYISSLNAFDIMFLVFLCFSHRPLDLDNVYNQNQVKLVIKEGDTFDEIPDFDKVFDTQACYRIPSSKFLNKLISSRSMNFDTFCCILLLRFF